MSELARKLMNLSGGQAEGNVPTAIFGTASTLARNLDTRERARIGLWPVVSEEDPALAMGIATAVGFLLERWQDVRVYRLFARLEGDPAAYSWSISDSQFLVDDWQLDQLDENVAIWGALSRSEDQWLLSLEVENDLGEGTEASFSIKAGSLAELVNRLPEVVNKIGEELETNRILVPTYRDTEAPDAVLHGLLEIVGQWQINLLLALWGVDSPIGQDNTSVDRLINAGESVSDDFGTWMVSSAIAHAMMPGYGPIAEAAVVHVDAVFDRFDGTPFPAILISNALFTLGRVQDAYDLMEGELKQRPDKATSWLVLIDLYRRGGRGLEALDTFQRAIEAGAADAAIYRSYATLLNLLDAEDRTIEEYVMIDPADYDDDYIVWEAIAAYEAALELEPDRADVLQQQALLLIDVNDEERLWLVFERLVVADDHGDAVRTVIDAMFNLEDIEPAIEIIEAQAEANPSRVDLLVNLAVALINDEDYEAAGEVLEDARAQTEDPELTAEIDRFMLTVEDPHFEEHLGDITALVGAGGMVNTSEVEFLEDAIDKAPLLGDLYVLLSRVYAHRDDIDTALEVLLDGYGQLPEDPDIIEQLARVLWHSDENALAFDYLNRGIEANPNHVPLLALTGLYLFEDGQRENARIYLARAEAIAPRHPAVTLARNTIAQILSREAR